MDDDSFISHGLKRNRNGHYESSWSKLRFSTFSDHHTHKMGVQSFESRGCEGGTCYQPSAGMTPFGTFTQHKNTRIKSGMNRVVDSA